MFWIRGESFENGSGIAKIGEVSKIGLNEDFMGLLYVSVNAGGFDHFLVTLTGDVFMNVATFHIDLNQFGNLRKSCTPVV